MQDVEGERRKDPNIYTRLQFGALVNPHCVTEEDVLVNSPGQRVGA